MRDRRRIVGIAAALFTASVLATPAGAGKADNSVRFGSPYTLANVDPYYNTILVGSTVADAVWDTLIYRNPENGEFKGELASSWRWMDNKTLELDLRHGVKFHNGAEFTADDVVYTFDFVRNPRNKASNTDLLRWIDHVDKIDAFHVRIVCRQPFPAAIAYLSDPMVVIHPHAYYAQVGPTGMNARPIGTGPFRVTEHALGKYIHLERNPNYWTGGPKPAPKIDKVDFRYIPDAQTRAAEMVAGGLDLIWNVARDQAEQLRGLPALRVVSAPTQTYFYLRMNSLGSTPAPPLRDIRVRQAISHAIDRQAISKFILGNDSQVLHVDCHPLQFGCDDALAPRYTYDPGLARQLLAEAGYPNGFDVDLYAWFNRNESEALIGYLRAVGIRARLRFMETIAVVSARRAGRTPMVDGVWNPRAIFDASASVSRFYEYSSDDLSRDSEVRDLLLSGDSAMEPNARKNAYAKALKLIAERAYSVPLYSVPIYYLAAKDLVFNAYPDATPRLREMYWK